MKNFETIDDATLDQVTGGGIISDLLDETIGGALETGAAIADDAIELTFDIIAETENFISKLFGHLGDFFDGFN